jgi:dTMP kinase
MTRVSSNSYKPTRPAPFIVVDGVNGAGKSTLLKKIAAYLAEHSLPFIQTREPGGSPLGQVLRSMILEHSYGKPSPYAELLLFSADRAHHIDTVIKPALAANNIVLCDRFFYSTVAFQGAGRGLPEADIDAITKVAVRDCFPDAVILLDVDPAIGLQRVRQRVADADAFEDEELAFHTRLRGRFLAMADSRPESFFVLDATPAPEVVWEQCHQILEAITRNMR